MGIRTITLSLFMSTAALAATTDWQKSFDQIASMEPKKVSFGLTSTVKFGIKIGNYQKEVSVHDVLTIEQKDIVISGEKFKIDIAHKVYDPSFPTVIGHFGFSGDVDQGNAKYFALNFHNNFPNYNLLLIQTMASAKFALKNCHYVMGGIDEALSIINIASDFISENNLSNELYLIGGSSSSAALFHSSVYLHNQTDKKIRGVFLQSGFNHMGDIINVLESSTANNFIERRRENLRKLKAKDQILSKALLTKRISSYKFSQECRDQIYFGFNIHSSLNTGKFALEKNIMDIQTPSYDEYYELVIGTYQHKKDFYRSSYQFLYPNKTYTADLTLDYYKLISLENHIEKLNFPFFWLHAKDDPLSDYRYATKGQNALKSNKFFASAMLKNGGHAAFKEVQGEEYLNSILKVFFDGTNNLFNQ